jgi:hypothetical protein
MRRFTRPSRGKWRQASTLVAAIFILAAGAVFARARATSTADVALCSPSAVRVVATTGRTFAPGQAVVLRSRITNISSEPCSVWLGVDPGFSPSFAVTGARGTPVWDGCRYHDRPGACFHMLTARQLQPGASLGQAVVWDQGTTQTGDDRPQPVAPGTYTLATHYQNIDVEATRTFTICRSFLEICGLLG